MKHNYIVPFIGAEDQGDGTFCFAFEKTDYNLSQYCKANKCQTWHEKWVVVRKIARAIEYLHRQRVAHGHVCANNVLVSAYVKLKECRFMVQIL